MSTRTVVVAHREAMVAEGIAAALTQFPGIVPIAVATTAPEGERQAERADAAALDEQLPGIEAAAGRLRRRGVRVVFLGDRAIEDEGVRISTRAPVAALARALVPQVVVDGSVSRLTRREREVLTLAARGLAGKEIARYLGISPKTVERHKTSTFAKLGVPNQAAAVGMAMTNGLGRSQPWNRATT